MAQSLGYGSLDGLSPAKGDEMKTEVLYSNVGYVKNDIDNFFEENKGIRIISITQCPFISTFYDAYSKQQIQCEIITTIIYELV